MMPSSSSTTNSSMNKNDRKRRGVSLTNPKKIRRTELIHQPKTEKLNRSSSIADTLYTTSDYLLSTDVNFNNRLTTFKQIHDSYENDIKRDNDANEVQSTSDEHFDQTKTNFNQIPAMVVSSDLTKTSLHSDNNSSTKVFKLVVPRPTSIKMLFNGDGGLASALRIPTKIQLTKTLSIQSKNDSLLTRSNSHKSSTSIENTEEEQAVMDYPLTPPPPIVDNSQKMNQTIKAIKSIDSEHQIVSKRHSYSLSDWSVPPTSELSPTSLTSSSPDDSLVELDLKINQISSSSSSSIKRRYRSLSFSCPVLPYSIEKTKPITPPYKSKSLSRISNSIHRKIRPTSPVIKHSSIERLKRRRRDQQIVGKRLKSKTRNDSDQTTFIINDLLNEMIEQIQSIHEQKDKTLKIFLNKSAAQLKNVIQIDESRSTLTESIPVNMPEAEFESIRQDKERVNDMNHSGIDYENNTILRRSKTTIDHENFSLLSNELTDSSLYIELKRQTSTPLSFHSIASSSADEQSSINSPHSVSKTHIFTDIVNELINGAKGLDKFSCSLVSFTNSIHNFIRLTIEKQTEKVENLQHELEKKCSSQLNRAIIFCTKKIQYFINKHSILSINEHLHEITLIVQYFYLYVLSLNYRKQENEFESILTDLINEKYSFINELVYSSILTTIIEDFILSSSLANDYLLAQPMVINQIEYSLPFVRNIEYENELLSKNDISLMGNPFSDANDLEEYLHSCEHFSPNIPYYPAQQFAHPPIYYPNYPPSGQFYYPSIPSTDMSTYYYHSPYSNSQQTYGYNHRSAYYNSLTPYHEQYNYYYHNQQTSYNSTNDIPLPNKNKNLPHPSYRRANSNIQKKHSLENSTSNVASPQSKSTTATNPIYPS